VFQARMQVEIHLSEHLLAATSTMQPGSMQKVEMHSCVAQTKTSKVTIPALMRAQPTFGLTNDPPGKKMMTRYCQCDLAILDIAGKFFIDGVTEAGKILEKVICPALQALDIVIAVGTAALPPPGKAITGGMSM
jgi:hypothetical protein